MSISMTERPAAPVFAKLSPHMAIAAEGLDLRATPGPDRGEAPLVQSPCRGRWPAPGRAMTWGRGRAKCQSFGPLV